jgi:hypothetical protein
MAGLLVGLEGDELKVAVYLSLEPNGDDGERNAVCADEGACDLVESAIFVDSIFDCFVVFDQDSEGSAEVFGVEAGESCLGEELRFVVSGFVDQQIAGEFVVWNDGIRGDFHKLGLGGWDLQSSGKRSDQVWVLKSVS